MSHYFDILIWIFRPEGFATAGKASAMSGAGGQIDDDMLPPAYSDSDYSDDEEDFGAGNPNRPRQVNDNTNNSDIDTD